MRRLCWSCVKSHLPMASWTKIFRLFKCVSVWIRQFHFKRLGNKQENGCCELYYVTPLSPPVLYESTSSVFRRDVNKSKWDLERKRCKNNFEVGGEKTIFLSSYCLLFALCYSILTDIFSFSQRNFNRFLETDFKHC